jgi:hypothetical protein
MLRTLPDHNPTMDLLIHDGIEVSIDNQPEDEGMQKHWLIETPE